MSIVFLLQIYDYFAFFLRQILLMQSNMISVKRAFSILEIKSEKDFISLFDKENHFVDQ